MFAASAGLVIKEWPDEGCAVVYAPALRTTHLVNAASARLLHQLGPEPLSYDLLVAQWVDEAQDEPLGGGAAARSLHDALTALEAAELISSSP